MLIQLQINGVEYECLPRKTINVMEKKIINEINFSLKQFEYQMELNKASDLIQPFYEWALRRTLTISDLKRRLNISFTGGKQLVGIAIRCNILIRKNNGKKLMLVHDRKVLNTIFEERKK